MKLPDFDAAAERSLISNWVSNEKFRKAFPLDVELFRFGPVAEIAKVLATVHSAGLPVSESAVLLELQRSGRIDQAGGLSEVSDVLNNTPTVSDPWRLVESLKRHSSLVKLRASLVATLQGIDDGGDLDAAKDATASALRQSVSNSGAKLVTVRDAMDLALQSATTSPKDSADIICRTNFEDIDRLIGWLRRQHVWVFGAVTNWGKCLGPGVPVRMSDGSVKPAQDVAIGDLLMGPDSKPRRVASLSRGVGPMFKITPRRGTPWTCNWCHVLTVISTRTGVVTDIALDEFLKRSPCWRRQQKLFHGDIEFPERAPPRIDPWFLGIWYGDGTKGLCSVGITTPDAEVVEGLNEIADQFGLSVTERRQPHNKAATYFLRGNRGGVNNPLLTLLRDVTGERASRLPEEIMLGSRSVRLNFLAGYIDSDGYKKGDRYCEIVTQHREWADQLRELSRSLGLQAHVYEKTNVPGYEERVYFRVHISGDLSVIPTRVERKKFPELRSRKDPNRVGFKVEAIGDGEYFGWTIDGDPHFLLGDFTVTHNTSWAVALVDEVMNQGRKALIVGNEDSEELYGRRLLARRSQVNALRLRDRQLTRDEIAAVTHVVAESKPDPFYLDAVGRNAEDVAADVASICAGEGIDVVVFDYMQKSRSRKQHQDRRHELSYIRDLYGDTCKKANVCCFQLSQLTGVKDGERPSRENIRDCKDLAHGAEFVLFGWTPNDAQSGEKCIYIDKAKDGAKDVDVTLRWCSKSASFLSDRQERAGYEPSFDEM